MTGQAPHLCKRQITAFAINLGHDSLDFATHAGYRVGPVHYGHCHSPGSDNGRAALARVNQGANSPSRYVIAQLARLRTCNRFHREIVAMARLAEVDWRQLMLANLSYDLVLAFMGCSTIALPTAEGPVLARNMDWWPEDLLARASYADPLPPERKVVVH